MSLGASGTFTSIVFTGFIFVESTTVQAKFAMAILVKLADSFCGHFPKVISELNEMYF